MSRVAKSKKPVYEEIDADADDMNREKKKADHTKSVKVLVSWKIIFQLFVFRLVNAYLVRSFFSPDEYWQGPEVAHSMVFGYGGKTWEWSVACIRGYLHPLVFAALFQLLKVLQLDFPTTIAFAPRVLQAFLQAATDWGVYALAGRWYGSSNGVANWALFCQLLNWFNLYNGTRTFSSCMESCFVALGLLYWSWDNDEFDRQHRKCAFLFAAISCAVRPTAVVFWAILGVITLLRNRESFFAIVKDAVLVVGGVFACTVAIDSYFYQRFIIVPWEFAKFNLLSNQADIYGTQPFYWYFTTGLPTVLLTMTPFVFLCLFFSSQHRVAAVAIALTVVIYSIPAHKEFRFMFPFVGPLLVYAGYGLCNIGMAVAVASKFMKRKGKRSIDSMVRKGMAVFLLVSNLPLGGYLGSMHQVGTVDVVSWIADEANFQFYQRADIQPSIEFLMPCHSTPYYSHVHRNISMRYLDCSPFKYSTEPNQRRSSEAVPDEADRFFANPLHYLSQVYGGPKPNQLSPAEWGVEPKRSLPTHLVFFDSLQPAIAPFLRHYQYQMCGEFFHGHLAIDARVSSFVLVACRLKN